ncbi:MAG: hypothetical protein WC279_12190 [Sulfurimonas sp.]|jgi:hypothetical protein|uniref:hypothetical protein n=1 Tax=Sulfurimonas sp. TaxID=2022749 RepID=UPI0035668C29
MLLKELKELYEEKKKDRDDSIANGVLSEFLNGEFTMLEKIIYRMENKRKPLSDGTLELTDEELSEFIHLFYPNTKTLKISASGCFILSNAERNIINNYKAILYLAERFELTEK